MKVDSYCETCLIIYFIFVYFIYLYSKAFKETSTIITSYIVFQFFERSINTALVLCGKQNDFIGKKNSM